MLHLETFKYRPGRCAICTSTGPGVFFERDLGEITADLTLGALLICDGCIGEAYSLGPESRIAQLLAENDDLKAKLVEVEKERDAEIEQREVLASAFELVERTRGHQEDTPPGAAEPDPKPRGRREKKQEVGA